MDGQENVTQVSPKKQKKLDKIEAKLSKKRERAKKTVVLDNFGKSIIRTFVVIAFIAILLPFGMITLSQKVGEEDVSKQAAMEYLTDALDEKPSKIVYTYKNGVYDNSEEFVFDNGVLVSRVTVQDTVKKVIRKPTIKDKTYILAKYTTYTDEQIADYVKDNNTEYLVITYTLSGKTWTESTNSLANTNKATLDEKGTSYASIIAIASGVNPLTTTITSATAETEYNLLGFGYSYKNYTINFGENKVIFDGKAVKEVYNFTTLVRYNVEVEF